ncbi:hypothetical protein [Achromobacter insolitus]|uniref:hypothetical protein n=1 Tax=Achromobacter insolitus TaxID=217204 RepID=UPI001EEE5781|nr:hypothetical protein [Achromobacter insolitus]
MARPVKPEQHAALPAIRNLIAEHGEELGLKLARVQFAHINKSTWHRWVAQVKAEDALFAAAEPMPVAKVPAPPTLRASEVIAEPGVIDFFGQVGAMMAACDALQDYAWPRDPAAGGRKVRNPMMLERATRLRATVLDLGHRRDMEVWNAARVRNQHEQIMNAISEALKDADDLALAQRIIGALNSLRARHEASSRYLGAADQLENAA